MSSGKEQQCITTSKTRTSPPKNGTRTLNDSFGRSGQARSATRRKHTAEEKAQVLETVEATPGSKGKVLLELGVFQERLLPLESQTKTGKP